MRCRFKVGDRQRWGRPRFASTVLVGYLRLNHDELTVECQHIPTTHLRCTSGAFSSVRARTQPSTELQLTSYGEAYWLVPGP